MRSSYIAFERRLSDIVNLTTEERYIKLVKNYPDIGQRVAQHMIASYLGLPPRNFKPGKKTNGCKKIIPSRLNMYSIDFYQYYFLFILNGGGHCCEVALHYKINYQTI